MALSEEQKKKFFLFNLGGTTIIGTCCGLSFVPWSNLWEDRSKTLNYKSWYPRFVLGSVEEESDRVKKARELYVGADVDIPFSDVTMKWGTKRLEYGDVLVESCAGEGYYVAKHIWDDQFRLDTWETINWSQISKNVQGSSGSSNFKLSKEKNGKVAKTVKLNVQNTSGGGATSSPNKSIIVVSNCSFKLNAQKNKPQEWKSIEMKCTPEVANGSNSGRNGNIIIEGEYKNHYVYTVTKN